MVTTYNRRAAFLILAGTDTEPEPPSSDEVWGIGVGGVVMSKALKNDSTNLRVYMDGQAIFKADSYSVSSTVGIVLPAPTGFRISVGLGAAVVPALKEDLTLGGIAQARMVSILPWFDNSAMLPEFGIVMASGKTLDGQVLTLGGLQVGVLR